MLSSLQPLMWHVLPVVARPMEALLGVFCILSAIALYPAEEKQVQSKFEDFWIRVDDRKNLARSRNTKFMQSIASLETSFLDRLFGRSLISLRAISMSFSLSVAIMSGLYSIVLLRGNLNENSEQEFLPAVAVFGCSFGLGLASVFMQKRLIITGSAVVVALTFTFGIVWFIELMPKGNEDIAWTVIAASLGSLLCDAAFIALTRKLISRAAQVTSLSKILIIVFGNLTLAILLLSPILLRPISLVFFVVAITNVLDVALAGLFFLLSAVLLIHRVLWPLFTRTLFKMQDIGTKGRRAILTAVGVALLSTSVFSGKFPELLNDITKIFVGSG